MMTENCHGDLEGTVKKRRLLQLIHQLYHFPISHGRHMDSLKVVVPGKGEHTPCLLMPWLDWMTRNQDYLLWQWDLTKVWIHAKQHFASCEQDSMESRNTGMFTWTIFMGILRDGKVPPWIPTLLFTVYSQELRIDCWHGCPIKTNHKQIFTRRCLKF